jgi:hypothetical protein
MARQQTNVPVTNAMLASGKGVVKTEALGAGGTRGRTTQSQDDIPWGSRAYSAATRDTDPERHTRRSRDGEAAWKVSVT